MRWIEAADWPVSMDWPLNGAPSAHPKAEQRESKLEGEIGVCAKALQQRTRLVRAIRCHVSGFVRSVGLGPWIADVRGE
jgi:hypothetical protein